MLKFIIDLQKKVYNVTSKFFIISFVLLGIIAIFISLWPKNNFQQSMTLEQMNKKDIYGYLDQIKNSNDKNKDIKAKYYSSLVCSVYGEACINGSNSYQQNVNSSLVGQLAGAFVAPYAHPPASGIETTYSTLANAGLAPKAYAAEGIGTGSIKTLAPIWTAMRNLTYLILVLVIVIIGFLIMFRFKVNAQTVVSVENALPKIVLTLLYITFSFAIAGFLIDLMYILTALVISVFGQAGNLNVKEMQESYLKASPGTIVLGLFGNGFWQTLWDLPNALLDLVPVLSGFLRTIVTVVLTPYLFFRFFDVYANTIGKIDFVVGANFLAVAESHGVFSALLNSIGSVIILAILGVVINFIVIPFLIGTCIFVSILFVFFRLLFLFFSTYLKILLLVVMAPLYILFEAIPGRSAFMHWFRSLAGELLTFPLAVGVFVLAKLILQAFQLGDEHINTVVNNPTANLAGRTLVAGTPWFEPPFLFGINDRAFGWLIGMGFLFITPDIVTGIKSMIVPKSVLPLNFGLGTYFGGVSSAWSSGTETASKYLLLGSHVGLTKKFEGMLPWNKGGGDGGGHASHRMGPPSPPKDKPSFWKPKPGMLQKDAPLQQ